MACNLQDIVKRQIGRWHVISLSHKKDNVWLYKCRCSCELKTVRLVRRNNLKSMQSMSCGCLQALKSSEANTGKKHAQKISKNKYRSIWLSHRTSKSLAKEYNVSVYLITTIRRKDPKRNVK